MRFTTISVLTAILFSGIIHTVSAQGSRIGEWRDHLPYNRCISLAIGDNRIYTATQYSLYYYDKADSRIDRKNKVNGLSDEGLSSIAYCKSLHTLVIAYSNANIDLIKEANSPSADDQIVNIPDIKRKQILGNKTINSIYIEGKYAYLSCGFAVVVVDIDREEIHDTYYIGPMGTQINVLAFTKDPVIRKFYAATEKGIYSADSNSNLANYENWTKDISIPSPDARFNLIAAFGGRVYTNSTKSPVWDSDTMYVYNGSQWDYFVPNNHSIRSGMAVSNDRLVICNYYSADIYKVGGIFEKNYNTYNNSSGVRPNAALFDASNNIWIADNDKGLWMVDKSFISHQYLINGPSSAQVAAMDVTGNTFWAVPGGRNASFGGLYRSAQFYSFENETWTSYTNANIPLLQPARDILCVSADPYKGNHAFLGSWGYGIFEMDHDSLVNVYTPSNSSLQASIYADDMCFIGGMAYDSDHNLWVTNSTAPDILSVKKNNGEWKSYNLGTSGTAIYTGGIIVDHSNQKWLQMRDLSLLVFNDNNTLDNTSDDKVRKLTNAVGNGNLPGNGIASFAVDMDGQMWLGSDQGVAVIYSPENAFSQGSIDAQQVMIEEEGYLHPLLETEAVTAIAVTGNNEKWLGTDKSGVFLMSPDGSKEIYHFTEENSPLLSNSITSIKISSDGEVFFGTSNGIVSFKDWAMKPAESFDSIYVYPNPVKENYTGSIAIKNLVKVSSIKITDMSGNLVWDTQSQINNRVSWVRNSLGGQVVWDGNDLDGRRVKTGVYVVFAADENGNEKAVAKVLFVK